MPSFIVKGQMYPGNYQPQIRMWAQDGNNMIGWLQNLGRQNPLPPGNEGGGGPAPGPAPGPLGRDGSEDDGDGGEEERDDIVRPINRYDRGSKRHGDDDSVDVEDDDNRGDDRATAGSTSDEFSSKYDEGKMGNPEEEQPEREEKEEENYAYLANDLMFLDLSPKNQNGTFKTSQQLLGDIVNEINPIIQRKEQFLKQRLERYPQLLENQKFRVSILTLNQVIRKFKSQLDAILPEYRSITQSLEFDIERAKAYIPKLLKIMVSFQKITSDIFEEMNSIKIDVIDHGALQSAEV